MFQSIRIRKQKPHGKMTPRDKAEEGPKHRILESIAQISDIMPSSEVGGGDRAHEPKLASIQSSINNSLFMLVEDLKVALD